MPRRRRSASKRRSAARQAAEGCGLSSGAVAVFFIDTDTGQIATRLHLIVSGVPPAATPPPRPWHRIQGTRDASTMWYAVMRRRERGVFIGLLVLRHSTHHASLKEAGWEETPIDQIGVAPQP